MLRVLFKCPFYILPWLNSQWQSRPPSKYLLILRTQKSKNKQTTSWLLLRMLAKTAAGNPQCAWLCNVIFSYIYRSSLWRDNKTAIDFECNILLLVTSRNRRTTWSSFYHGFKIENRFRDSHTAIFVLLCLGISILATSCINLIL